MKFVLHVQLLLYCFTNSFQDDFFILKTNIVSDKTSYSCATNSSSLTPVDEKTKINAESNCQPIPVLEGLTENFKISFSLKLDKEGYIFLCDGKNITRSSCYWFLLQTESGTRTKLRKCSPGNISLQNHHVPFPCSVNIDVKRHPEDVPKYLSGKKWSNFELIKNRKSLRLNLIENKTVLVNVEDIYSAINVTDMLIYTNRGEGFWKISQTKNEDNLSVLMLISRCSSCGMRLYLLDLEEEKNYGEIQIWTEIKLSSNDTKQNEKNYKILNGNKLFRIKGLVTCKTEELKVASEDTYCENIQNKTFCALCLWIHSEFNSMKIVKKENRLLLSNKTDDDMEEKRFPFHNNKTTIVVPLTVTIAVVLFLLASCYFCYLRIKIRRKNAQLKEEDILLQISLSKMVKLQEFQDYVKNSLKNGELKRQFTTFETSIKNGNYYSKIKDGLLFDYIDLRLSDHVLNKAYLICEIPKPTLANEFWNTVWSQNVKNMILFDNITDSDKTNQFWPEMTDKIIYRDVSLQATFYGFHPNYETRTLLLNKNKQNRTINHYRFNTNWFDNTDSMCQNFVKFLLEVSKIDLTIDSPLLVHSRSGFSGTTFVVLCDMSIRKAIKEDCIDILRNLKYLNDCNQNLIVDSFEQFKMAHVAILQYFLDTVHYDLPCYVPVCR